MSFNRRSGPPPHRDNRHKPSTGAIRKSVLRNPQVPLQNEEDHGENSKRQKLEANPGSSSSAAYHHPRMNELTAMQKQIDEIKGIEFKQIESLKDLTMATQSLVNRQISAKLNYGMKESIYKNLPKIFDDEGKEKASVMIQHTTRKVTASSIKDEMQPEIDQLVRELVELEYEERDKKYMVPQLRRFPGEDVFLGFSKFSGQSFLLPSKRLEAKFFADSVYDGISKEFIETNEEQCYGKMQMKSADTSCVCLQDFHTKPKQCS